jgi:hypothetical protein
MVNLIHASCPTGVATRFFSLGAAYWVFAMLFSMNTWFHTTPLHAQTPVRYAAIEYARIDDPGAVAVIRSMNSTNEVAAGFQTNRRKASSALIFLVNKGSEDVAGEQGAGNSVAYGINDQGEIAGAYDTSTAQRPFRAVRRVGF